MWRGTPGPGPEGRAEAAGQPVGRRWAGRPPGPRTAPRAPAAAPASRESGGDGARARRRREAGFPGDLGTAFLVAASRGAAVMSPGCKINRCWRFKNNKVREERYFVWNTRPEMNDELHNERRL